MGRIQRKKATDIKKKKKQTNDTVGVDHSEGKNISAEKKKSVSKSVTVKEDKKKKIIPQSAVPAKPKDNLFTKALQFLREVKIELKKVAWPSRKQTIGSTAVVIALVMLISLFLGVVDLGLSSLIRVVLQ